MLEVTLVERIMETILDIIIVLKEKNVSCSKIYILITTLKNTTFISHQ